MAGETASELTFVEGGTAGAEDLVEEYLLTLRGRSPSTVETLRNIYHPRFIGTDKAAWRTRVDTTNRCRLLQNGVL